MDMEEHKITSAPSVISCPLHGHSFVCMEKTLAPLSFSSAEPLLPLKRAIAVAPCAMYIVALQRPFVKPYCHCCDFCRCAMCLIRLKYLHNLLHRQKSASAWPSPTPMPLPDPCLFDYSVILNRHMALYEGITTCFEQFSLYIFGNKLS